MAQQVFAQWHPVAKALDEENNEVYIPFAGIHAQTRDGKDEVIFGAGAMVWDPNAGDGGMWVPVDAANPMEVRVRQLEAQIAALQQFLEGRLNADLADVLARLNTDLSTRASEQTLVQARDALSALAGTVDAGAQKVALTGREAEIVINTTTEVANQNLVLRAGGFGTSVGSAYPLDTSKYRILALFVHNGMDAQIRLYQYMAYFNDLSFNDSPYPNRIIYPLNIAIPSGASQHITIVDIPQMDKEAYPHVRSIWRFDTTGKTDGELRAIVVGVPW